MWRGDHELFQHGHARAVCSQLNEYIKEAVLNAVVDGVQLAPNLEDIMSALLCRKKSGAPYFDIKCIQGLCPACKPGLSVISNLELDDEAISHLKPEKKSVTHSVYDLRHTFTPDQIKERENAGVKTSKSRVRVKMTETLPELLNRFGKSIEMYGLHKFLATWQNKCARNILTRLRRGDIISEWDFAENYTFFHQTELQQEYWRQKQISLLISLTHYWEGDEIITVVDVYLSGDKHHDTHYFQKAFLDHQKKYNDKLGPGGVHYVFTDGAPSHFKNKFTIAFLIHVYKTVGITVMWGFNAPAHGKGAWDGIGELKSVVQCVTSCRAM